MTLFSFILLPFTAEGGRDFLRERGNFDDYVNFLFSVLLIIFETADVDTPN